MRKKIWKILTLKNSRNEKSERGLDRPQSEPIYKTETFYLFEQVMSISEKEDRIMRRFDLYMWLPQMNCTSL